MATNYWLGGAVAVPEVYTLSIAGTWATSDTCWVEINGKRLTLTVGADAAIDDVGAALEAMINGDAVVGTESRSALGSAVGEFAPLTADYDSATDNLVITGQSDGRPIGTLTSGETTTGDGTLAVDGGDVSTAGTGPYHWSDVTNWSTGALPVDTVDSVVFDHQAASSCLYGISVTSIDLVSLKVTSGFRYSIGLPEVNKVTSQYPIEEHLTTFLSLSGATTVDIDGTGAGSIKIDLGTTDTTATVRGSGTRAEQNVPSVLLNINNANADLHVLGGDVGLCFTSGTTGQISSFTCGGNGQSQLTIGDTVTIATGTVSQGTVIVSGAITTLTVEGGEVHQTAGTITTLNINGGVFWDLSTGTITTVTMNGGRYDKSQDNRAKTITNFTIYARCSVKDPVGALTVTNGFDIYPKLQDVTLDFPNRRTYTLSSIA